MSLPINYESNREWNRKAQEKLRNKPREIRTLAPSKPLCRTRIKPQSKKGQKRTKAYKRVRDEYMADHPFCEVCQSRGRETESTELHHKNGREGDNLTDKTTFLAACSMCHKHIHYFPDWARENGFLGSKFRPVEEEAEEE